MGGSSKVQCEWSGGGLQCGSVAVWQCGQLAGHSSVAFPLPPSVPTHSHYPQCPSATTVNNLKRHKNRNHVEINSLIYKFHNFPTVFPLPTVRPFSASIPSTTPSNTTVKTQLKETEQEEAIMKLIL